MLKVWKIRIPELSGDKTRRAYVYLPYGYSAGSARYPVLYMFDGHNLFRDSDATYGKSWGLKSYLDKTRAQIIVAAVECNHSGNSRLSEYSPVDFTFKDGSHIKGRGRQYMDWLVREFKPYIDGNYRTLADRVNTAIAGSSMGGLMSIYAVAKYNDIFSKGAALSPSLWVEGGKAPGFVSKEKFSKDTVLYTDYGSREFVNHESQKSAFINTCAELIAKDVNLTARIVAGGTHSEASWEKQIPFFMKTLFGM